MKLVLILTLFSGLALANFNQKICGKTLHTTWVYKKAHLKLIKKRYAKESICKTTQLYPGANVRVQISSLNEKQSYLFYDTIPIQRVIHDHKQKNKTAQIIDPEQVYKIIKFPITKELKTKFKYKITGFENLKIQQSGELNYE